MNNAKSMNSQRRQVLTANILELLIWFLLELSQLQCKTIFIVNHQV